jgi:hypothetical protein
MALAALAGCGNSAPERTDKKELPKRARRVIEPSTERVGPLPPYAIRADGVGPLYKLGDKLSDLLERLASGPRIAVFEIPGVVHRNVIRAEDDTILIGGEQASTASFIAVVDGEVARTESGIHVGSTREELIAALGPPAVDPERARDPRLVVPSGAPSMRAVLIADRIAAIVVASPTPVPGRASDCPRPTPPERAVDDVVRRGAGRSSAGSVDDVERKGAGSPGARGASTAGTIGACLTAAGELIEIGDDIVIRSADGERALAPPLRLPGLVFAAPLRSATEARDELVVVTRSDESASRTWWLAAYRLEGARLVRTVDASPLYQLSSANARWIGADLHDVELYLELTGRPDAIEVGGLLTTQGSPRAPTKIRDVVVIATSSVPRKRGKSAQVEPTDASTSSAAMGTGGGSPGSPPASPLSRSARVMPDATPDEIDPADSGSDAAKP